MDDLYAVWPWTITATISCLNTSGTSERVRIRSFFYFW
jgi:hypothetical protein